MNKSSLLFLFLFIPFFVFSQQLPDYLERDAFELSLFLKSPTGNYREKLNSDFVNTNSLGFSASYLRNPLLKKDNLSHILFGAELGFSGNKQREFAKIPNEGIFFMNHRETHLFFKARYLSQITPENYIPYLDIYFGPRLYSSSFLEDIGEDEQDKFYNFNDINFSYGADAGIAIKTPGRKASASYFSISLGIASGNAVKLINRNKTGLDSDYKVIEPIIVAVPQSIFVKLAYINFR
jgi:hypothetical protein